MLLAPQLLVKEISHCGDGSHELADGVVTAHRAPAADAVAKA
jgi:hypothetical protein